MQEHFLPSRLASLVLYGDLEPLMNGAQPVQLTHGVESMKLLPPQGFPPTKPPSYGVVTQGVHIVAMTGSYFRGDAEAVLAPQDEANFDTVTYSACTVPQR